MILNANGINTFLFSPAPDGVIKVVVESREPEKDVCDQKIYINMYVHV